MRIAQRASARPARWAAALVALATSSAAAAFDESLPWPDGAEPDAVHVGEQLEAALELDTLETFEEFLEAVEKGEDSEHVVAHQEDIDQGLLSKEELFARGDAFFSHEFRKEDGFGDEPRPLPLSRVHRGARGGLDTFSCAGCHSVGGPDGAGALTQNAFLDGDGDHASSAIVRNAPAVLGLGFVQVLGEEMTRELQGTRDRAQSEAVKSGSPVAAELVAKGVRFGVLRAFPDGTVDTSRLEGIAEDLVVRPFGWKGSHSRLRRFAEDAALGHFGIQSHVLAEAHLTSPDPARLGDGTSWFDPDGDGKARELEEGSLTAAVAYMSMLESPVILRPYSPELQARWTRGSALFDQTGCSTCHVRELPIEHAVLREVPDTTGGPALEIDLMAEGDTPKSTSQVALFSDLKRHDMGAELADARESGAGVERVARSVFLTRPLWGLAESAPYMHDGRATTIPDAIVAHGGEGAASRDRFVALPPEDRASLHVFLLSLTRSPRPRVIR